jgi:oligopeptide/dipeptide ABC transporter ATP-binding protein
MNTQPLLSVQSLRKLYPLSTSLFARAKSFIHAVDGVDFDIWPGESLALVGESGSGKTTTGRLLTRLTDPTEGTLTASLDGETLDVARINSSAMKRYRRHVQMIFQDPYESLNPRKTIFDIVVEPLNVQRIGNVAERQARVADVLAQVGLAPPESFLFRYPHELSGGQRQRVAIARALVIQPSFVVADEPTSMLDVSVRASVMQLMQRLADQFGVTYLYITHDLAVARYMSNRLAVMCLGKIVEIGATEEVLRQPIHPYTQALLSAVPVPDPSLKRGASEIKGGISKPIDPKPRCRFYDRCPLAQKICADSDHPPLVDKGGGHHAACWVV